MIDAPRFVQRSEHIGLNNLVANHAEVAEELMVVRLAVGQTFSLVVSIPQERFLAFSADEVLNMPVLAEGSDHSLFNRTSACSAYRDSHLVVAAQTVQLVEFVGRVARPGANLPGG